MDPKSVPEWATPEAGSVTDVSEDVQVSTVPVLESVSVVVPAAPAVTPPGTAVNVVSGVAAKADAVPSEKVRATAALPARRAFTPLCMWWFLPVRSVRQ
jgi:hypothetical protein